MNASNWLEERILNHFFRGIATQPSAQCFLALFISDPTDAGIGTEVQGGSYTRKVINFTAPAQVDGRGTIFNDTEIRFPVATSNWGTVTHFGIYTAATDGDLLAHGVVIIPKLIETGDEARFNANALSVSID